MKRTTALIAGLLVAIAVACSPSNPAPATTTTTAIAAPVSDPGSTTTTEVVAGGEGFRTRQSTTLAVGTERLSPPWYTGPSADEITGGFEFALAREIGSRLGVPIVKVVPTSLVLMMTGQDCKCDIMLGAITITDGRARTLDLTEPYVSADQGVIVRQGTTVRSASDGALLRWGVAVRNTTGLDVIRNRVKPAIEPYVVVNEDDGIRRVADGRLDAMLLGTPEAIVVANTDPTLAVAGQFRTGEQYAVALSLGSPNTSLINDVIHDMRNDGIIDALLATYLGVEPANVPIIPP